MTTFHRTQQILSWRLLSSEIYKDSCSRLQVGDFVSTEAYWDIQLSRSQYVIHPSWATGWYWTRPGSIDMCRSSNIRLIPQSRFQRNITDGDFEFLKFLSHDDLTARSVLKSISLLTNSSCFLIWLNRMSGLDSEMEKEIDDLRRRYHAKRFSSKVVANEI